MSGCGKNIFKKTTTKQMTSNQASTIQESGQEGLSEREKKKMNQAIRIMEKNTNPITKQPKRNAHHLKKIHQTLPRKILKTDIPSSQERSDDASSSHPNQPLPKPQNTTPPPSIQSISLYNPKYAIPEGEKGIFVYMMDYSYREREKFMEMGDQDWSFLQQIGTQQLKPEEGLLERKALKKTMEKLTQMRGKIEEPFSKEHRDFTKKFINQNYLFS